MSKVMRIGMKLAYAVLPVVWVAGCGTPSMQFVIRGDGCEIVPVAVVPLSDPHPRVVLDDVPPSEIFMEESHAVIPLSGTVTDPVADNIPRGKGADIASVEISVNGAQYGAPVPVIAADGGEKTFWRQCPYKGRFGPIPVRLPITPDTWRIRATTSRNAAGNVGYDELVVGLGPATDGTEAAGQRPADFSVQNLEGSGNGSYIPFTTRVKRIAEPAEHTIKFMDTEFGLVEHEGWYYPGKDDFIAISVVTLQSPTPVMRSVSVRDVEEGRFPGDRDISADAIRELIAAHREKASEGDASSQHTMGSLYLSGFYVEKDYAEAERWLRMAADQGLPDAQNSLAWFICDKNGSLDEALALAMKATQAVPDDGANQDTLGWVLCAQGKYDAAIEPLSMGVRLMPCADHIYHLGYACMKLGRIEEATSLLQDALSRSKDAKLTEKIKAAMKELARPSGGG